MATANGKIPTSRLSRLPDAWNRNRRTEHLRADAYAALSRALAFAAADGVSSYSIYDAYRPYSEQKSIFLARYYKVRSGAQKYWNGSGWRLRSGQAVAAVPGTSNHGLGLSVDIHSTAIQRWLRANGRRFGFIAEVRSEAWHWSYLAPGSDIYRKSMGPIDHATVQKLVGAGVDGRIGPKTIAKIKEWQKSRGLTADGKIGPKTYKAMGLGGGKPAPAKGGSSDEKKDESKPEKPTTATSGGYTYTFAREDWDTQGVESKVHAFDHTVEGTYLHYPGSGNVTLAGKTPTQIGNMLRGYRVEHTERKGWSDIAYNAAVDQAGNSYELRGLGMEPGANGGTASNNNGVAILLMVGNHEKPTDAMLSAVNGLLAQVKAKHKGASFIRGHQQSPDASTECPGPEVMALIKAGEFSYDGKPGAQGSATTPTKPPASSKIIVDGVMSRGGLLAKTLQRRLGVTADGKVGAATIKALQKFLGTPVDGKLSGQPTVNRKYVPAINAAQLVAGSTGSKAVRAMQKLIGAKVDGKWGKDTNTKLAQMLNARADLFMAKTKPATGAPAAIIVDGVLSRGGLLAKTLQTRLGVTADGVIGPGTIKALQRYLGTPVDGKITGQPAGNKKYLPGFNPKYLVAGKDGSKAVRALQAYVGAKVDGKWGAETNRRLATLLNKYPAMFTAGDQKVARARAKKAGL